MPSTLLSLSVSRSSKAPVTPLRLGLGEVLGIGGQDRGLMRADRGRHADSALFFCSAEAKASDAGGGARTAADLGHGRGEIAGSLDAFQRRGHGGVENP